jgi:hypothetical protein
MGILRKELRGRFTTLPNEVIEDPDISFRAKGILAYLLSKPDGWNVSYRQLKEVGQDGAHAVMGALKELEDTGYLTRWKQQDDKGRWTSYSIVRDHRVPPAQDPPPGSTHPRSDLRSPEVPSEVSTEQVKTVEQDVVTSLSQLTLVREPDPHPAGAGERYPQDFERFWKTYPRRIGKRAALQAWRNACKRTTPQALTDAAAAQARAWEAAGKDPQFIPHPATWLNQGRYDDEPESPPAPSHGTNSRAAANDAVLREFALAHGVNPEIMSPEAMYGLPPSRKEIG